MEEVNDTRESLWNKFRKTLQVAEEEGITKRGNQDESVAMGMSQFGGQRQRLNYPTVTMRRGDPAQSESFVESRPNYEEYVSPAPAQFPAKFYAVAVGRRVGIFDHWEETKS